MNTTIRRGYADTALGQLHYAESGAGRPIVLLHQAPRSHDEFAEVQAELPDFHTIAMDMLGFGMSPPLPAPMTIEAMADSVVALLDALGLDGVVLLGHHTGAAVAMEVAAAHPSRVSSLVLSATPWIGPERRASDHGVGVDTAERAMDGSHLTELWRLRRPYYPADRPDLLDRFIRDALVPDSDPAEGHRACDRYLMDERVGLVTCPTLVLTATGDPFAVRSLANVVSGLGNASRLEQRTLEGATIPAMEQCADQVAAHVREFLAG